MRNLLYALLLVPFLFAAKCGEKVAQFTLNENFDLMPGQMMACDCGDMQLTFVEVKDDSRCPKEVNCIRAGEAHVIVKASGANAKDIILEINADNSTNPTQSVGGYQVQAISLGPYPVNGQKTNTEDYRLQLRVSQKAGS